MTSPIYTPSPTLAKKIARQFGTPTFIIDSRTIIDRINTLKKAFTPKTKVYYAIKANYNPAIVKLMLKNGIDGIDATSPFEIKLAKEVWFSTKQIIFTGNNSSTEELKAIHREKGITQYWFIIRIKKMGRNVP